MLESKPASSFSASFSNEPPVDFSLAENRQAMNDSLLQVREKFGKYYPLVIDGKPQDTGQRLQSFNPSCSTEVVGMTSAAEKDHVNQAIEAAKQALPAWEKLPIEQRAEFLQNAASVIRKRLFELSAWIVYECGKPWREATNDVCEAIDFCNFYASEAKKLHETRGADVPGEQNRFEYLPRGVTGVIAPWNFPLAILTGMTAAALVTGNTVIMKPAEQSPVIAAILMEIFQNIRLPPGVVSYLPGKGEVAGAELVEHSDVALIAFTGSRAVGLEINRRAAEISSQKGKLIKRVIAEMGGKNAIIVDEDADLDEAVLGVAESAFGYAGQKCSACSRVIVLRSIYDSFLRRLVECARSFSVGPAKNPSTKIGPVIDEESLKKVQTFIELGRQDGREVLSVQVKELSDQGFFVGPHIYADISSQDRLAQEEVFGPVLAVLPADDLDQALRVANDTEYALTGGIYSRSPKNLERARQEFLVGNLYLNRNITGALVGRQPFGGFRMSGIGSKAGGEDYLLQFVVPRTITENTMRRGFAPPEN